MKTKPNNFARGSALRVTFSIGLIFVFAILLASAAVETPTLGNYPDTTLALSTDTTVAPDAPPTNTISINVSTSTDFKGTLAGDPITGVVRVTDAHPAGTYTVTVIAFDSGGETASKTFTLTVTTPATCFSVGFATATNHITGNYPYSVAVGDFNGDGKQDLATANAYSDNVSILLGDGAGNFSAPTNFTVGDFPNSVAVGDFNGDGKQDLATANAYSDNVSILLGDGAGSFSVPTSFAAGDGPERVAVGDFNGDGKQDLAVANYSSDNVSILLGDGAGNFSVPTSFAAGDGPFSVAVGDFNGDGKQDLAVVNYFSDNVSILLGNGDGNFSAPTNFAVGINPNSVAVGDFNGDGKQDLATANEGYLGWTVSILLGDGTGTFSAPRNFGAGISPNSVAVGDFNGDGKQDLVVANSFYPNSTVSILLRDCPVSQITPTGTTCSQFSSGTAETLGSVQYGVNNRLIDRVGPGNFLYWVAVTAPAGENTLRITQTITTGNFNTFFEGIGFGSNVFDSNCVSLERGGWHNGDTAGVRFNAPAAGTYFIGINFNAQSLLGQPAPSPETTVHYDFTTTGVPDSTSGLDLVEH
jgi:hypothetical protein